MASASLALKLDTASLREQILTLVDEVREALPVGAKLILLQPDDALIISNVGCDISAADLDGLKSQLGIDRRVIVFADDVGVGVLRVEDQP